MENIIYFKHTHGSLGDHLFSRLKKKKDEYRKEHLDTLILQNVVVNFILASRDTSSIAMSWFFWLIIQYPHVEYKVY